MEFLPGLAGIAPIEKIMTQILELLDGLQSRHLGGLVLLRESGPALRYTRLSGAII